MSKDIKFTDGVKFLSTIYEGKFNGRPFDRITVKSVVTILAKMGFEHVGNQGTLAILSINIRNVTYTIHIGRKDDESFFQLITTEQTALTI